MGRQGSCTGQEPAGCGRNPERKIWPAGLLSGPAAMAPEIVEGLVLPLREELSVVAMRHAVGGMVACRTHKNRQQRNCCGNSFRDCLMIRAIIEGAVKNRREVDVGVVVLPVFALVALLGLINSYPSIFSNWRIALLQVVFLLYTLLVFRRFDLGY